MITEKIILWDTKYGRVRCNLYKILRIKKVSVYQLARLTNIRYEILKKYANNEMMRFDSNILAKICYVLNCNVNDIMEYVSR